MIRNVTKLKSLLNIFPLPEEISYCFAYGSAIFDQSLNNTTAHTEVAGKNDTKSNKMIDLVLAVQDPLKWHQANLDKNWSHYSGLKYLGASNIAKIQQSFDAKVFYNAMVPVWKDSLIKYGIISTKDLLNDLLDWETLYISGRLHKPILVLHRNHKYEQAEGSSGSMVSLKNALEINRQSVLHAALLLLPEKFTEEKLYLTISGLSYSGDFRMWFGEDRSKVEKIVRPQIGSFRQIYFPLLQSEHFKNLVQWCESKDFFEQNCSKRSIAWHLNFLPKNVQFNIVNRWLKENTARRHHRRSPNVHRFDMDDLMRTVASDIEYERYLRMAIQAIVFRSSTTQTIKGFFTAGPTKSIIYSAQKIQKMIQSLR